MSIKELEKYVDFVCPCGKTHNFSTKVVTGEDILFQIPALSDEYSADNVYVICDNNTYRAAGKRVIEILTGCGKSVVSLIYESDKVVPDESSVGKAIMHLDKKADLIVGVGSGVINDIGKIVANVSGKPYFIVATAPSMDGYAAAGSSMELDGVKTTVSSKAPDVIIGDLNVLASAPPEMMISGLGDMIAKYVALCEWHIASIVVGEYYCEEIAELVRIALKKCVDNSQKLIAGDKDAIKAVFEGLIISGAAIEYAGISRPASGVEHYISHIIDMRSLAFNTRAESHGIQCALGTLYALKMYECLKSKSLDKNRALDFVKSYSYAEHSEFLKHFLGKAADKLISLEEKEGKYNQKKHAERLQLILDNWEDILKIINGELPSYREVYDMWRSVGGPVSLEDIGIDNSCFKEIFASTKDIRDKYVLSRLLWDLGLIEEIAAEIFERN